jgi:hypothetical protein
MRSANINKKVTEYLRMTGLPAAFGLRSQQDREMYFECQKNLNVALANAVRAPILPRSHCKMQLYIDYGSYEKFL